MSRRRRLPPTMGTTALLALASLAAVLVTTAGLLGVLVHLVAHAPGEAVAPALGALQVIGMAALGALGGSGIIGAGIHGARHLGGPPAPTSGELSRLPSHPSMEEP